VPLEVVDMLSRDHPEGGFGQPTRTGHMDRKDRRRVFALDVLACPRCVGHLRVIATMQDPLAVQAILRPPGPLRRSARPTEARRPGVRLLCAAQVPRSVTLADGALSPQPLTATVSKSCPQCNSTPQHEITAANGHALRSRCDSSSIFNKSPAAGRCRSCKDTS
jgi:uncharacterized protein YbaR (Trm112 family)